MTDGASLHVFSATDDFCFGLPNASWEDKGTKWKYKDPDKNTAQVKDAKLKIKIKAPAPLDYTLDEPSQGTVNAILNPVPQNAQLGSVFCIPATGNGAIDGVSDLPGPGAIGLNGDMSVQ